MLHDQDIMDESGFTSCSHLAVFCVFMIRTRGVLILFVMWGGGLCDPSKCDFQGHISSKGLQPTIGKKSHK